MEYPMLVMCSGYSPRYYLLFWHEIGHNYFMGAVSTNQTDRAFLDEGFTTFLEIAAMEHFLGREDNLRIKRGWYREYFYAYEEDRIYRGFRPYMDPALQGYTLPMPMNADCAPEWLIYRASSYYKPVCMLFALEYILGKRLLYDCIRGYYGDWKFKHPYERDMFESFERASRGELTWFFEQWVYTDKKLDYAVSRPQLLSRDEGEYRYRLKLERVGEMVMPIRVQAALEDGTVRNYWIPLNDNPPPDGEYEVLPVWDQLRDPYRIYTAEIILPARIKSLDIDPESLLADLNPLNNRWPFPKIQFDWLVEENSPPVNAYQIRQRPGLGYNIIDGAEVGWKFKGSYLEYRHNVDLSVNFGLLNFRPDWSAGYHTPISKLSPQSFIGFSAFDRDGFQGGGLALWWRDKPFYRGEPVGGVKFAFQHRRHYSDDYPPFPAVWEKGVDNSLVFSFWREFFARGSRLEFKLRASVFCDDFSYSQMEWSLTQPVGIGRGFDLKLGLFAGLVKGDEIPSQRLLYPSGWEPEIDRGYEYWGVRSLVPSGEAEHFLTRSMPGIYGLYGNRIGEKSYAALSSEMAIPPKFGWRFWLPFLGDIRIAVQPVLFANFALGMENQSIEKDYIWEAGPGIKLSGIPGGDFHIAFPLWIDPALPGEDNYDFRWVLAFVPSVN
ncbi:MAG: hypothetical protein HQ591_09035 [candidate division Zixibacteria bacterium]|nr:hypothetical protein [Candidatus Tariuqbacter arcticus]